MQASRISVKGAPSRPTCSSAVMAGACGMLSTPMCSSLSLLLMASILAYRWIDKNGSRLAH